MYIVVYVAASSAFDRVHYGKLFNILLYKKVPFVIIRLLLDAYIRQEARVIWNSCKSQYFRVKNGVKQGGVISPILFNLYIDRLLLCLQRSGLGCHISNTYMGALSYADDITLISPSLYGSNRMLDICNKFAIDNFIIFNSKKTICIKYGEDVRVSEQVLMNGRLLSWHSEVRHLGNFFIIGCVILQIVIRKLLISLVSSINFTVILAIYKLMF